MIFKISKSKLYFLFYSIVFKVSLDVGYIFFVSEFFGYMGFNYNFNVQKYILSFVILILIVLIQNNNINKVSDFYLMILSTALLAPLLSQFGLADKSYTTVIYVSLSILTIDLMRRGKPLNLLIIKNSYQFIITTMLLTAIFISLIYLLKGGFSQINLDLTKVYDYRDSSSDIVSGGLLSYISQWTWKIFGVTLVAFALKDNKKLTVIFMLSLYIFWFGVSSHKSVLFYPIVIISIWFLLKKLNFNIHTIPLFLSIFITSILLISNYNDNILVPSLFLRRVFFVVSNNTFDYFEFFSINQKVWWSNSILSFASEYPYEVNPADLIGQWRNTNSHVNNSFISTAYMHGGLIGIIIYSVFVGLIFRLIDSLCYKYIELWLGITITFVPFWTLIMSADLLTAMLTHGILICIIVLFFVRKLHKGV